ncbi:MAG: dihydrodipicolinate reductase [Vicinamibacteria bacterium]|jgi:4-hydroxy-tetrahydrodipicolinate reductase|nr:dihydrodipicolinate reductase [Vicinamibacteria bacterium]
MSHAIKVVQVGLGSIGQGIARMVLSTPELQLVGACDSAPEKAGQDLGLLLGLSKKLRVKVQAETKPLLKLAHHGVAIVATSSSLKQIKPLVLTLVGAGYNVITTCEELAFPTPEHESTFHEIDRLARKKKARVIGAGVNPGFAMDLLPIFLTATCGQVKRVAVTRVVDLATRRLHLQRKVGAGLTVPQFRRASSEGNVRHHGLLESLHMIAATLGFDFDRVEETVEPATAPRDLDTSSLRIPAGAVTGIKQFARGYRGNDLLVSLDLQMYVGAESPRDHILIEGAPAIDATIAGGISGDVATAAIVVNCIPKLLSMKPGLIEMKDLPHLHRLNAGETRAVAKKFNN